MSEERNRKMRNGVILALGILVMSLLAAIGVAPTTALAADDPISIPVNLTWEDNNNEFGLRPESVKIVIKRGADATANDHGEYAGSYKVAEATVTARDNWSHTFTNLDARSGNGNLCVYYIEEEIDGDDYVGQVVDDGGCEVHTGSIAQFLQLVGHSHVTFKNRLQTKNIWANVIWHEQFGPSNRPESVKVRLLENGEEVASANITEDIWDGSDDRGTLLGSFPQSIVYTLTANPIMAENESDRLDWCPAIYDSIINERDGEFKVHEYENTVQPHAEKTWADNNDQYGKRPDSLSVSLLANREVKQTITISSPDWQNSFSEYPCYVNGKGVVYTVSEVEVEDYAADYQVTPAKNFAQKSGMTLGITNTYMGEGTCTVPFEIVLWDSQYTQRTLPSSMTVRLYAETGEFPQGTDSGPGGLKTIGVYAVVPEGGNYWRGNDTGRSTVVAEPASNTQNTTTYEGAFQGVPMYGENDEQLNYWVGVDGGIDGYRQTKAISISTADLQEPNGNISVKKAHASYITNETVDIQVNKEWADNDNANNNRPDSVTYRLYLMAGRSQDGTYSVSETEPVLVATKVATAEDGYSTLFAGVPRPGAAEEYIIGEDPVPGYAEKKAYVYDEASGKYKTTSPTHVNGLREDSAFLSVRLATSTITNREELRDINIQKIWEDEGYEDERPDSISFGVYADGELISSPTMSPANLVTGGKQQAYREKTIWSAVVLRDMPVCRDGQEIDYSIVEDDCPGYESTIEEGKNVLAGFKGSYIFYLVTNTYADAAPETVDIPVTKTWNDNDNELNNRPESVTYELYSVKTSDLFDGGEDSHTEPTLVATKTASKDDDYACTFEGLPAEDDEGNEYTYLVGEETVPGYYDNKAYRDNSGYFYTLKNVFDGTNAVNIVNEGRGYDRWFRIIKAWNDEGHEGERPESVTVNLLADDEIVGSVTLSAEDVYTRREAEERVVIDPSYTTWAKMLCGEDGREKHFASYRNGQAIEYTVEEEPVDGYESESSGPMTLLGKNWGSSLMVTNTYVEKQFDEVYGIEIGKSWNDEGHEEERPESITVRIYGNGEEVDSIELSEEKGWSRNDILLPAYDDGGEAMTYQIIEDEVEGYTATYEDNDGGEPNEITESSYVCRITNTYVEPEEEPAPETRNITITKFWDDQNDKDGIRPESITVRLLADGKPVNTIKVEKQYGWKHEFVGIAKNDSEGNEIVYTVEEDAVNGYTTKIAGNAAEGFSITNTHTPKAEEPKPQVPEQKKPELVPTGVTLPLGIVSTGSIAAAAFLISKRMKR